MSAEPVQQPRLVIDGRMDEPESSSLVKGVVGVYSARSPAKGTPNEDAAAVIPAGRDALVLAVADGLGGNAAGEQAARIALECLKTAIEGAVALANSSGVMIVAEPPAGGADSLPPAEPSMRTAILNGLEQANREIMALGSGAATTLAVVEISERTARPYHVGDSMILLIGGRGKIKIQTIPHSPVGYGVEAGLIDEAEAMHHEDRHLVSNFVGCPEMRIEIGPARELAPRDTLLLASDGLADNLHVEEIVERIRKGPLQEGMRSLAREAADRMRHPAEGRPSKPDDLTFVVYRPRWNVAPRGEPGKP